MTLIPWPGRTDKRDFSMRFCQVAQEKFPAAQVSVRAELDVELVFPEGDKVAVFLGRAYAEFCEQPQLFDAIAARWLALIEVGPDATLDLNLLVPMIKDRVWLRAVEDPSAFWIEDYNPHLVIAYAEERAGFRYCRRERIDASGQTLEQLRRRALHNLAARSRREFARYAAGWFVNVGGNFEAAQILLDGLWNDFDAQHGGPCVVALPDRDTLAMSFDESPDAVWALAAVAAKLARSAPFPITPLLFRRGTVAGHLIAIDDAQDDDSHPLPRLGVIDIQPTRHDGTVSLIVVIASALDASPRSVFRLLTKLDGYLVYVGSEAFRNDYGKPSPQRVCVEVFIHPQSAQAIFQLLSEQQDWVRERGATLVVSTELPE